MPSMPMLMTIEAKWCQREILKTRVRVISNAIVEEEERNNPASIPAGMDSRFEVMSTS
jgi:hypothetical protein